MNANDLYERIKESFYRYFPNSYIGGGFSTHLGTSIHVWITLGKDKSEYSNGIIQNDPMHANFFIYGMDREGNLSDTLEAESSHGMGVMIPSSNPMYVYDTVKVPFRKTKGNADRILKAFDVGFSRLYDTVKEHKNVIQVPFDINRKL